MMTALDHLIILPILLPLVAGAAMLLLDDRHRPVKAAINVAATLLLVVVAIALVVAADAGRRSPPIRSATGRCRSPSSWWPTGWRR